MRMPRRIAKTTAMSVGFILLGGSVAFAASLQVAVQKLTVFQTATSIAANTCTLTASADTFAAQEAPTFPLGTFVPETLVVRSREESRNARAFVRFNIASCVPAGSSVQSATMRLFMETAPSASRTYQVNRINASPTWGEGTLTWNNQPGVVSPATAQTTTGTAGSVTLQWNVAADVQAFVSGGTNNGWRISDTIESSDSQRTAVFTSKDTTTGNPRPQLVVTYYP